MINDTAHDALLFKMWDRITTLERAAIDASQRGLWVKAQIYDAKATTYRSVVEELRAAQADMSVDTVKHVVANPGRYFYSRIGQVSLTR